MIGTGKYDSLEQILKVITDYTVFYPQQDQFDTYEELYPEWKELYEASRTED